MKDTPQPKIDALLAQLFDAGLSSHEIRCAFESALKCAQCQALEEEQAKTLEEKQEDAVGPDAGAVDEKKPLPAEIRPTPVQGEAFNQPPNQSYASHETPKFLHDLIVVGAGPHALAVVSRLLEERPSALYTDLEHARLSWLRTYAQPRSKPKGFARKLVHVKNETPRPDIVVLDKHSRPGWMPQWTTLFENLEIRTLRSPMFFHPGPADLDGLLAYAVRTGRENELTEIPGVVGKELSKHAKKKLIKTGKRPQYEDPINERDRRDYQTPGSNVFLDFCREDVQDHYGLSQYVTPGEASSISYDALPSSVTVPKGKAAAPEKAFTITLKDGRQLASRAVVLAVGNNSVINAPEYLLRQPSVSWDRGLMGQAWCHTSAFARPGFEFPTKELKNKMRSGRDANLVVIGGGLTSAQIIDIAYRRGVRKLTLLCRSHLKMKPFDFDTTWVDKFQNLNKMIFWREEDYNVRRQMILEARNGGSVNQPYYKILRDLQAQGQLDLRTCTAVFDARYDSASGWSIDVRGPDGVAETLEGFDYLVSATGSKVSVESLPFLDRFRQQVPVETCNGFPILTHDLQWGKDVPFFLIGGMAALELGPSAFNLGGAREGAERIANRLSQLWADSHESSEHEASEAEREKRWKAQEFERRAGNHGGFFDVFAEIEAES